MSFTYNNAPLTDSNDEVRFLLGDKRKDIHLIEDEEITYALDKENNNAHHAAARLADGLSARFAREAIVRTGSITTSHGSVSKQFADLANRLRQAVAVTPFVSNLTDKGVHDAQKIDTSIIQPSIKRGFDRINRGTTSSISKTSDSN